MAKRSWNYTCSILHKHFLQILLESFSLGTIVIHKKTGNNGYANYFGGGGGGGGCKHGVLWAMWKLWMTSCYSHCSLWHQVPGCPHNVMDKLLNLTDKLRSSKDSTVRWCFLVFNLLVFSPSHYTETTYERVPGQFLNGRIFYLCNPFNRNRANSVTVVFTRVRTNFCQCQH